MLDTRRERSAATAWAWAVAAITAAVFARSLTAGFLDFDDVHFLINNPRLQEVSWQNLRWMLGANWVIWYPLTWLSWSFDHAVWGGSAFGYHLTNVLLHALNAALAFKLFDGLMEKNGATADARTRHVAAAFAALVFALHPLRVESVTWASERSDVLCASFALGAALAWISGRPGRAVLLHALGLASKGTNVALPLALIALDGLGVSGRDRPRGRQAAAALAAMLGLSAADGLLNISLQRGAGAAADVGRVGFVSRAAIALWSYAHGAGATLWPARLEGLYPTPSPFDPLAPRFLLAALAVTALTAAAWRLRKRAPAAAGAWSAYLLLMAPTAGFFKVGAQLTADRYTYLPALGFAGLAGEGLRRAPARSRKIAAAAALAALLVLSARTWQRQGDYLDADRFWNAMVETDPANADARFWLALRRIKEGRASDAERLLREVLAIDPDLGNAHNALGNLLVNEGRPEEALAHFRAALALHPEHTVARYNMALALIRLGRRDEAALALREELALIRARPDDPLRDSFEPRGDETRTRALLDSLAPRGR